ncbi:MAG: FmdB family zinc ribbon protein [Casimicrobiaceae bacterium]
MPIYEYRCSACSHKLESLQRLADAPLTTCPACGKETLTKLLSAAGFQLKGSGWYATDFKNAGAKPPAKDVAKSDGNANSKADATGGSASTDTKADAAASSGTKADTPAASPSAQSDGQAKTEKRAGADKPAATTGTPTTGGS